MPPSHPVHSLIDPCTDLSWLAQIQPIPGLHQCREAGAYPYNSLSQHFHETHTSQGICAGYDHILDCALRSVVWSGPLDSVLRIVRSSKEPEIIFLKTLECKKQVQVQRVQVHVEWEAYREVRGFKSFPFEASICSLLFSMAAVLLIGGEDWARQLRQELADYSV